MRTKDIQQNLDNSTDVLFSKNNSDVDESDLSKSGFVVNNVI